MEREKKTLSQAKPPRLVVGKTWFIEHYLTGNRVRVYGRLNTLPIEERQEHADQIIAELLKPNEKHEAHYTAKTELYKVLEAKKPYLRKTSLNAYETHLKRFCTFLATHKLTGTEKEHALRFILELKNKGLNPTKSTTFK